MKWVNKTNIILLMLAVSLPAWAQNFYRYVDADGNVVMGSTIETEAIKRGYEILDAQGRIIEEVPAALTGRAQQEQLQAQRQQALQDQRDEALLQLYAVGEDVERAKQDELAQLESIINTLRARILRHTTMLQNQQQLAAQAERRGETVSEELLAEIASLEAEIASDESKIEVAKQERAAIAARFDADRARLEYLLERQRAAIEEAKRMLEDSRQAEQ